MEITKSAINNITREIISCAIDVHKFLGPGLLESVYHSCMSHELLLRNIPFSSQLKTQINYKGFELPADLRCDFLVADQVVVEIKSVEHLLPVHKAQVLTYLSLLKKPKGILINFNCTNIFREGQITLVNELFRQLPD